MKVLFFATNSYPYGKGEPLIVDQIPELSKKFDKIIIVAAGKENKLIYVLPENVEHYCFSTDLSFFQKIIGSLNIFSPIIQDEIGFLKSTYHLKFNFLILKILSNSFVVSIRFKKLFNKIIKDKRLKNEEIYFHSYWCTEAVLGFVLLKKKFPNAKMTSRFHAYDLYNERHDPNYLPFRKLIITSLDKMFFISEHGKEYFTNRYKEIVDKNKVILNRLGVYKSDKYNAEKVENTFEGLKIVSCSALIELKRIHLLIEAFSLVDSINIKWIHFGNGPLLEELKELAEKKLGKKKSIHFLFYGFIQNDKLKEYFHTNHIDLFINVSMYEGIPISIMEAMSFGIPCIGTNAGGVSEIINPQNGYLLPVDFEIKKLADLIIDYSQLSKIEKTKKQENAYITWETKYNGINNNNEFLKEFLPGYQICTRCIYDNVIYPQIKFDNDGVCSICKIYENLQKNTVSKGKSGEEKLKKLIAEIKRSKKNKTYDCVVGVSGGVDSSYVAYLVKEWNLRPLIIHIDNGWNSELAVQNIKQILSNLEYDLHTYVINWEEMKDLQRSFIKANVLDIDLPFDNLFMAVLFKTAKKHGIKYILSGHNTVTEGWMPENFTHYKLDTLNIKDIHKKNGTIPLKTFPLMGPIKSWVLQYIYGIKLVYPLDYIEYNKNDVKRLLIEKLGWRDYEGKHYENIYTKFYQGYILPNKFGIDKRVSHFSTLINSGQMTRDEAKHEIEKPPYNLSHLEGDKAYFLKKLEFSEEEFEKYMNTPEVKHTNYRSYINVIGKLQKIKSKLTLWN